MISCENSLKGNSRKLNKWETNKFSICLSHHLGITPEKLPFDPHSSINQTLNIDAFQDCWAKVMSGYLTFPYFFYYPQMRDIPNHAALYLGWWSLLNLVFIEIQSPEKQLRIAVFRSTRNCLSLTNCFLPSNFLLLPFLANNFFEKLFLRVFFHLCYFLKLFSEFCHKMTFCPCKQLNFVKKIFIVLSCVSNYL